jgi:hypothetical protein
MPKRIFWVLYDYGQGGLWAVVNAESIAQIVDLYPSLQVFEGPPEGLDRATIDRVLKAGVQEAERPRLGWMHDLLRTTRQGLAT